VLYFVIPFMLAITILGMRELWLNVVRPWQEGRKAEAEAEAEASPTTAIVHPPSRSACVSPTHTIATRPARQAASALARTSALVSL